MKNDDVAGRELKRQGAVAEIKPPEQESDYVLKVAGGVKGSST